MDDRSSKPKYQKGNKTGKRGQGPKDLNETAYDIVQHVAGQAPMPEPVKSPAAVSLGRPGGLRAGKARAEKLTPEERVAIAQKAAAKRLGEAIESLELNRRACYSSRWLTNPDFFKQIIVFSRHHKLGEYCIRITPVAFFPHRLGDIENRNPAVL
jgi:hypothetical protein